MTIKVKIIFGFIVLIGILVITSAVSYDYLDKASVRFNNFSRAALMDAAIANTLKDLNSASTQVYKFQKSKSEEDSKSIKSLINFAQGNLATAIENEVIPENITILNEVKKTIDTYLTSIQHYISETNAMVTLYNEVISPRLEEGEDALESIVALAESEDNILSVNDFSESLQLYADLKVACVKYNSRYEAKDLKDSFIALDSLKKNLLGLREYIIRAGGQSNYEKVENSFAKIESSLNEQSQIVSRVVKELNEQENLHNRVNAKLTSLGDGIAAAKVYLHKESISANKKGIQHLLMGTIIGTLTGSVLAILIIFAFARVLKDISSFATAISRGNFDYCVNLKEKGEVGSMVSAMQQIPMVLQTLIDSTINNIKKVQTGQFDLRLEPLQYSGNYMDLVSSVNTLSDAYTAVLNEFPLPVVSADKNNIVHFANTASKSMLNGKLVESFISEGKTDFGKKAIESKKNYTTEVSFIKDDALVNMGVTAIPLTDEYNDPVAFIEILTDLTEIRAQQKVMLEVAEEATHISDSVASASEKLAAQVKQVSNGAEIQSERIASTATAMTEMNATVLEVARNASDASEQSDSSRIKAQEGLKLVTDVISSINIVNEVSQSLHVNMEDLGAQAENIGSVMNVISDIADQTNLLALNAAIEAARAGDAGRGFAVVADEVRKLAEKTMLATQEVGNSINAIQESARKNIGEVAKSVSSVQEANSLANASGSALEEIVSLAILNSSAVASIATAAEEQSATSEEINQSIEEINLLVGDTTKEMVNSSASVQELSALAQKLYYVMEGLK